MLRSLRDLERTSVTAVDGDVGSIANSLFDDDRWVVRYLVLKTGRSFHEQSVRISPPSLRSVDCDARVVRLGLTCHEIMSNQGGQMRLDGRLKSARDVCGYPVQGRGEGIGRVSDFLVDDGTWAICGLVVDTGHWWSNHKVVVAPARVTRISVGERKVFMDMTRQAVTRSPPWMAHGAAKGDLEAGPPGHHGGAWSAGRFRLVHEAEGAVAGAAAGTVLGAGAGPPGMAAGAFIGAAAGALVGAVLDTQAAMRASRTRELDAALGVSGGDIGARTFRHPPAIRGKLIRAAD
jgi:hypothetical protein